MLLAQDEAVRIIIHNNDAMLLGKLHQSFVGLHLRSATSRHIGIVGPKQTGLGGQSPCSSHRGDSPRDNFFQLVEIGLPAIVLTQVVIHDIGTQNLRQRSIGRIARIGYQHAVARIDESQRDMQDTLFRANQWQQL